MAEQQLTDAQMGFLSGAGYDPGEGPYTIVSLMNRAGETMEFNGVVLEGKLYTGADAKRVSKENSLSLNKA